MRRSIQAAYLEQLHSGSLTYILVIKLDVEAICTLYSQAGR